MHPASPYSVDLMTRVLLGLGPPANHYTPRGDLAPSWDNEVRGESLSFAQSSSLLSDMVHALDQEPVGWFPPLYPPHHQQHLNQNFPSAPIPIIPNLLEADTFNNEYPDNHRGSPDSTSSGSTSSTPTSSASTRSPSPFIPTRGISVEPVRRTEHEDDSPESSPFLTLREKERKRIRQTSGVRSKAKAPQTHAPRSTKAAPSSTSSLEMVQCRWTGCTKRLHVDYVDVRHWGKHVREHYAHEQDMVQCKWDGGCGAVINKSSMWKHVVVHQPKFKIRCPRGCDVLTRGDMMRRHLQSCNYTPDKASNEGGSGEEETTGVEGGNYDGDGEDNEEEGKED